MQERLQTGERCLAVLTKRQILVRTEPLEPNTERELMTALRIGNLVFKSEQISGDVKIASVVASGQTQLGGWIRCCATADYNGADLKSR